TVGAVLFAFEQFVRGSDWSVEASGESDEEKRDADFLRENKDGMSHTWSDFVNEALTMLPFGFSVAEICYKKGRDGSVRWKKMPFRAQETIWEWIFDENGGIKGLRQNLHWAVGEGKMGFVEIPIEKLLLFRTTSIKGAPEGRSVFWSAYKPWYYKKKIEVIEAIGVERNLAGYPVMYVPDELFLDTEDAKAQLKLAIDIVTRIRKDENMGAV